MSIFRLHKNPYQLFIEYHIILMKHSSVIIFTTPSGHWTLCTFIIMLHEIKHNIYEVVPSDTIPQNINYFIYM